MILSRFKTWRENRRVRAIYANRSYLDAYRTHTNERVEEDPHTAAGGMWEEIGSLQFDYLIRHGLQADQRMLDIGCGTLCGGQHFIGYLKPTHYTGVDISPKAIEYAHELMREQALEDRMPRLLVNHAMNLRFEDFEGETFDYLLAQSVFTHLQPEHIHECFEYVRNIMHAESKFFFTFWEGRTYGRRTIKNFEYPFEFFRRVAARHGLAVELMDDYAHPRRQRMALLKLR